MHTKDALKALRKSLLDISKDFSEGADKIASVLVEDNKKHKGVKAKKLKRLKKELAATIRDVGNDIKKGLKNVKPKDIFSSTSYEMGKLLKATKDTYVKILDNLIK
jgi:hypothetical protein